MVLRIFAYINLLVPRWGDPHQKIYYSENRYRDHGKKFFPKN